MGKDLVRRYLVLLSSNISQKLLTAKSDFLLSLTGYRLDPMALLGDCRRTTSALLSYDQTVIDNPTRSLLCPCIART